ncbi:hypothetical protein ACFY9C_35055 [Streptomyces filamentosus]|uniref:hypothetical protein n=1 Tax=Streptomyces filamentosus TaxID=67294 RepID=UPI0036ECBA99
MGPAARTPLPHAVRPATAEDDWIRGLTVRQPWATAILTGRKTIENRPRPWRPGWFLLHAGKGLDRPALNDPLVDRAIRGHDLTAGAVLGVVRITATHQDPAGAPPCTPWALPNMAHLELADVQALTTPIPARGQLGPWRPTQDLLDQVLRQLPHLRP